MTQPDFQAGLLRLDALAARADLSAHVDPASRASIVAWGTFFTIYHQVRAVLTLHRDGVCFSAGPNRRTIVEYTLFLFWLADDRDAAVDALNRSLQNGQKLLATQIRLDNLSHLFSPDTQKKVAETIAIPLSPHPDERLLKAGHLLNEYGEGLKSWYAVESRMCHVSSTSMQFFFKEDPGNDAIQLWREPTPQEPMPCVDLSFHLFFRATLAFNSLLTGAPLISELGSIANDYGLDLTLPTRKSRQQP